MKFFNTTTDVNIIDHKFEILNNLQSQLAALIITIQIINKNDFPVEITFKKSIEVQGQMQQSAYISTVNFKSGTTILDHIIIVNPKQIYYATAKSDQIVISCSYGR